MLKQHKTFDLDKERVLHQPKREKLYEPKKCKYLKYIVIPALIAFILLCILMNVDFTGEAYKNGKLEIDRELASQRKSYVMKLKTNIEEEKKNHEIKENNENTLLETEESEVNNVNDETMELKQNAQNALFAATSEVNNRIEEEIEHNENELKNEINNVNEEIMELKQNGYEETMEVKQNAHNSLFANTSEVNSETNETIKHNENELKMELKQNDQNTSLLDRTVHNYGYEETMELNQTEQWTNLSIIETATESDNNSTQTNFYLYNNNLTTRFPNSPRIAGPAKCAEDTYYCALNCTDGSVSYIDENLQPLQVKCGWIRLSLTVKNCEFAFDTMTTAFFYGTFTLKYLAVIECNLQKITEKVFKETPAKTIQTLILRNNLIATLTPATFEGLTDLKYLEFVQQPLATFNGGQFLTPFAASLTEFLFLQRTNNIVLNPRDWLQGTELTKLITVDMSDNNFQDIIDINTFRTMVTVESLTLRNCNILTIVANTFDIIMHTLKYLDLSLNHLKTLDVSFLNNIITYQIVLNVTDNSWYCNCENTELISFLKSNTKLIETIKCDTPKEWEEMELKEVIDECYEITTTMQSTTTTEMETDHTVEDSTTTEIVTPPTIDDSTTTEMETDPITEDSTTTEIVIIPTRKDSTTPEIETDSTASESETTPTTPTTQDIKSTTNSATGSNDSTTPEISDITTPTPDTISIACTSETDNTQTITLSPHIDFSIHSKSSGSVIIQVPDIIRQFDIIYFTNHSHFMNLTQNLYSLANNYIIVSDLLPAKTYVFCLTNSLHTIVSPFDCRAHFIEGLNALTWLSRGDQVWFIAVIIIVNIIIIIISIYVVYIMLRKYPIWLLNTNERILPVDNSKDKVIVLSKRTAPLKEIERSSDYLTAQPSIPGKNAYSDRISLYTSQHTVPISRAPISIPQNDEVRKSSCPSYITPQKDRLASKYISVNFNRFQNITTESSLLYDSKHIIPADRAPRIPQLSSQYVTRKSSCPSYATAQKCKTKAVAGAANSNMQYNRAQYDEVDNDPDYQTIDHYEVVNF